MTCQSIQSRILALPDPRQVPDPLRDHLTACPGCAAWWRQAVQLERMLGQLPAPPAPSDLKAALIDDLTTGPVITSVPVVGREYERSPFAAIRAVPGLKYAAGLAAAVLIAVGGWAFLRPGKAPDVAKSPPPRHPFLERIVQRDVALARAKTPEQRLEILSELAADLSAETRSLAGVANQDELNELAREFDKVVQTSIVRQADRVAGTHALTLAQKTALLEKLAAKLTEAGLDADQAARKSPPHAQPALRTIGESARDGRAKLQALLARERA